ncbi:MAG: PAS domain S-box protein [Acidobacteriota bacterium]
MDQALLDVVADPIFVKDRHHRLVHMNEAFCRFMGSSREKLLGQTGLELVNPEEAAVWVAKDDEVLATGKESVSEEAATFADGRSVVVVTRKTLYVDDKGERFIVAVVRDITERKRAAEEREKLVEELRTALAEVRTLQEYLPICSYCRKVRDDKNYWTQIENYVTEHTGSMFSHGICPECYAKVVQPQLDGLQRPAP